MINESNENGKGLEQQFAGLDFNSPVSVSGAKTSARFHPSFEEEHPGEGQGLPTSHSLPPTSREDLWLFIEYPVPQRHYTFTNIHVFSWIQTQALRHSSQRR
ncbi:hypothetical protein TNCV_2332531 [Trichonephila clavipes]|nr:hypothetical protein TNCV_2332531 [Trichonephila clavipes]